MKLKTHINYIDVTNEWLNRTKSFSSVTDAKYYEHNGKKYYVDGKKVVLNYSTHEKEVAELLTKTFGGTIIMIPRINYPKGIKTPDYIWNNESLDLKEIHSNGKNTINRAIENSKDQSNNFIVDITNSKLLISDVVRILNNYKYFKNRKWIKYIIVIKNKKIKIFKHNKRN